MGHFNKILKGNVPCNSGNRTGSHCSSVSAYSLLLNLSQFPPLCHKAGNARFASDLAGGFCCPSVSSITTSGRERESLTGRHGCQTGSESTVEQAQCNQRWRGVITKVFTRRCPTEIPSHILGRVHLRSTHKNKEIST